MFSRLAGINIFVAVFAVLVAMVTAVPKPDDKYTTKYDHINIKEILDNDRLLGGYLKCLKGAGSCTPDGAELKTHIPDALNTECSKCSQTQKDKAEEVLEFLYNKKKSDFDELAKIYDPTGAHKDQYARFEKKVAA
ncbi:Ejaculatory bulb protein III [Carabus blaptoides fortunei]